MLNIVIPMAGRGSRFRDAGYEMPKPLIAIHGFPMIRLVISNLRPQQPHRFIFLCLQEHIEQYQVDQKLLTWEPESQIVAVDTVTEGAACTVLLAKEYINNDDSLMIANSDQWVDTDIDAYLDSMSLLGSDGLIMTMWANDPKWSFVKVDADGRTMEVVEKKVISNEATVGIYNFMRGSDFVSAAETMIEKNLRVNGEFYVAPVYNELIAAKKSVRHYNIGKLGKGMYGLGVPDDLTEFSKSAISLKAIGRISEHPGSDIP
jgi:NDP-sugar pyrophosphorylase family protein